MKRGIAKGEPRKGHSLTLPYNIPSIKDVYRAYHAGKPIDVMAGFYGQEGMDINPEFFMLDNLDKQHKIAEFKANMALLKEEEAELRNQLNQHYDKEKQQAGTDPIGQVPKPGGNPSGSQSNES